MTKRYSYWTTDADLYAVVKELATRQNLTLGDAVEQALMIWVGLVAPLPQEKQRVPAPPG